MTVFKKDILTIDPAAETDRICDFIRSQVRFLRRKGAVVGLSGGVDSALCSALCVRALGKDNVFGLILPERESSPLSRELALKHAGKLGIRAEIKDISPVLESFGTYEKRDQVVRELYPEFSDRHRFKIALPPDLLDRDALNFFKLLILDPDNNVTTFRPKKNQMDLIIAATSTKQRTRMMHLYYAAEKMDYLVCGTTNRSETLQGFFVKFGDGGVDIEPLAHLYKTQVYDLSRYLDVIQEIQDRTPSPDTYSFEVSDEEFYFRMPFDKLDLLLYAWEHKIEPDETGEALGLTAIQVKRAFQDFTSKYNATRHLRKLPPALE